MTVKKPDNSDDATDEDYINDISDYDYFEDAIHEVHIYDETNEDYSDEDFFMARPMKIILRTQLMKIVLTLNFHVGSRAQPPLCSRNGHRIACSDSCLFLYITKNWMQYPHRDLTWMQQAVTRCNRVHQEFSNV